MKAIIKKTIYSFLFYTGAVHLTSRLLLRRKRRFPVIILIYHRITKEPNKEINDDQTINHPLRNFTKEMAFIKKCFNVVSLDEAVDYVSGKAVIDKPTVAITFDDGYKNNYTLAYPVLKKLDIPVTVFLTAGFIDTDDLPLVEKMGQAILKTKKKRLELRLPLCEFSYNLGSMHDRRYIFEQLLSRFNELQEKDRPLLVNEVIKQLGQYENGEFKMMSWKEIEEMSQHNITFGAHTMSHACLSKMPYAHAQKEIEMSKKVVEDNVGEPVRHFAFPFGSEEDFNDSIKDCCREIGFTSALSAVYGTNRLGSDVYALKRLSPGETVPVFATNLVRAFLRDRGGGNG